MQLDEPIMLTTPFGEGIAHFVSDAGDETFWGVFQKKTGELWWWPNHEIRYSIHLSEGYNKQTPFNLSAARKEALAPHLKRHND